MGIVYRGRDDNLERDVALKVMSLVHGADEDSRRRFEREAKAAAKLQHPNIVTIYELGEHEGSPYMALELLEGVDLQRAIEAGIRPDPKTTLPVVLQLLSGLGHAHEKGIIHRDVKPSNVFLPESRPVKIMDFGVARLAGGMTTAGLVVGTPNYMSPEQVRAGPLDGRSDLFSAGLILYELVTGEKAYAGDTVVALLYKIAHEEPDLRLLPPGREWEPLRKLMARLLARDPDERYPSAQAVIHDLERALTALGGSANWATASNAGLRIKTAPRPATAPDVPAEPPATAGAIAIDPQPPSLPEPPAPHTSLWLAAGLGVGAAVLVVGVAYWAMTRPAPEAPPRNAGRMAIQAPVAPPTPAVSSSRPATPPAAAPSVPAVPSTTLPRPTPAAVPTPLPSASPTQRAMPPPETTAPAEPVAAPENPVLERAEDSYEKGRYAQALAEARAVLRREPGNTRAKTLVEDAEAALVVETRIKNAREALRKGDKETALEEVKAGLAVAPSDARLLALWKEATRE